VIDPSLVDWVATEAMGFAPGLIPHVTESLGGALLPGGLPEEIERTGADSSRTAIRCLLGAFSVWKSPQR
jgi:hypothetical protein